MNNQKEWQLVANGDWLKGQVFPLAQHTVLGRDSECDITIPGTHLSRRHAEIAISGNKLLVKDLGSSNGTFVNGKQVSQAELLPGDQIQFDVLTFSVEGPGEQQDINATMIRPAIQPKAKPKPLSSEIPAEKKQWKTKPTSPGNRSENDHYNPSKKIKNALISALCICTVAAVLAGIGFLITQL
ncbi:FHA domain-containing protein [Dasania sp. GY-MA-18]|uniref:FHA domain-containing protein n=1 Tax=Dasania phycosphaerae TaxID=2950436 RepID=A0A9J6RIG4_9GAMM|nr:MULTISPECIES: FHA domain-containing protein [Dasania]MCR8921709.1 FHA domain-containing protein [Dasania sp. GY-MA-18]MCZ0864137.1 FHA domain-containing protein [Dasania phycosphaerae]MCZ0867865.1 FHA domain-containing protein [Dasania phycosphaerae]